jgi:hypothetical protein
MDCARSMDVLMSHTELSTECGHALSRISGIEGFAFVRRREDLYLCATSNRKMYKGRVQSTDASVHVPVSSATLFPPFQ